MNKTYVLKPTMTFHTLTTGASSDKSGLPPYPNTPQARAARQLADALAPTPPASPKTLVLDPAARPAAPLWPRRQPLLSPVLYPEKKSIKLGLDVHLEFIMAVVQRLVIPNSGGSTRLSPAGSALCVLCALCGKKIQPQRTQRSQRKLGRGPLSLAGHDRLPWTHQRLSKIRTNFCGITTQAQRPGPRGAWIATGARWPGSLLLSSLNGMGAWCCLTTKLTDRRPDDDVIRPTSVK